MPIATHQKVRLVECPRDAMQGWKEMIPTATKVAYMNALLRVGFDTLDFGSFVSPKAIPQMADTKEVLAQLDISHTSTKLLAIVANLRGAEEAVSHDAIHYLGFPFSVSETFQQRNTNSSREEALQLVEELQELCIKTGKELVVYISMGFGNPYGDDYSADMVFDWVYQLIEKDIGIISLADTVGLATPEQVYQVTSYLTTQLPETTIGVHLHSTPQHWKEKVNAALEAGCRRFDGALKGVGGCPMAKDDLVGNMNSELMIPYFNELQLLPELNQEALAESQLLASKIFHLP
jgi:hydroxymethylglutaryl-CoA lyase